MEEKKKACCHIQEMKRLHSSRVSMSVRGFQQQGCKRLLLGKVGCLSEAHPGSKLLGLVRFPARKNRCMVSADKTWALPTFFPVYNTLLQGCQQDRKTSVLQRETAPVLPCLKSAQKMQQRRGIIITSQGVVFCCCLLLRGLFFFFFLLTGSFH